MGIRGSKGVGLAAAAITLGLAAAPVAAAVNCTIFCQVNETGRVYNQTTPNPPVSTCKECEARALLLECNLNDQSSYFCVDESTGKGLAECQAGSADETVD